MEILYHTCREQKRLWNTFLFSHLWDSIYWIMMILELQRHVPFWNNIPILLNYA